MQQYGLLFLVPAILLAAVLVYYQYLATASQRTRLNYGLASLRWLSLILLLILLLDPLIENTSVVEDKQELIVLTDHSRSMQVNGLDSLASRIRSELESDARLKDRFELRFYDFDERLYLQDTVAPKGKATAIADVLESTVQAHRAGQGAILLLSDGKQTFGSDYQYFRPAPGFPVFPVALGDTTRYADLAIERVNYNAIAFLNNSYVLETFLSYEGEEATRSSFEVLVNGTRMVNRTLDFGPGESKVIREELPANSPGIKEIAIRLSPFEGEKNRANNREEIALEVLDEKSRIALVSSVIHPDLGAIAAAIESNPQRKVEILAPGDSPDWSAYDLHILYQPGPGFESLLAFLDKRSAHRMIVAGPVTDWDLLNQQQDRYSLELLDSGTEEATAVAMPSFPRFDISRFDPSDYPPLEVFLGDLLITTSADALVEQEVRGVATGEPLVLAVGDDPREILWMGSGLWKWRMATYREEGDFSAFDSFIDKSVRYLTEGARKDRLNLRYKKVYPSSREAVMNAVLLDESLEFEPDGLLNLNIVDSLGRTRVIKFFRLENSYEASLSDLAPGTYQFTLAVEGENLSESGNFRILDRDPEIQPGRTPIEKMKILAENSGGRAFFPGEVDSLLNHLQQAPEFSPVLRTRENIVSLISIPWLLALLILSLALEWFIRKYNGLN